MRAGHSNGGAPFPSRPRLDVARHLRLGLAAAWSDRRRGQHGRAYATIERAVMGAIPDLEALDVAHWENIAAELREAQPPEPD